MILRVVAHSQFFLKGEAMKTKSKEELVSFLLPFADTVGVELVDVEIKNGRDPSITIFIETEDGVDLDTCEKFYNTVDQPLDEFDPTFGAAYTLNVSSPGLDRPFKTDRDFERNIGEKVEVKLYAPIKGKKYLEAFLADYDGNTLTLDDGKEMIKLNLNQIAKINKAIDFE